MLVFEKAHSLFKLIFKDTKLQKVSEYNIFQKKLFYALAPTMNFGVNTVPVVGVQYL